MTDVRHRAVLTWSVAGAVLALNAPMALGWDATGVLERLALYRDPTWDGQLWRLLTGHLLHLTPRHLLWDLATFVALSAFCERRMGGIYRSFLPIVFVTVGWGFLALAPDSPGYVGLSGVDCTLFLLAVRLLVRESSGSRNAGCSRALPLLAACLFLAKLGVELGTGSVLFCVDLVQHGSGATVLAHALGAAVAFLIPLDEEETLPVVSAQEGRSRTAPS